MNFRILVKYYHAVCFQIVVEIYSDCNMNHMNCATKRGHASWQNLESELESKGGVRCQFVKAHRPTCLQNCYWVFILFVIRDFFRYIHDLYRYMYIYQKVYIYIYITCSSYAVYSCISLDYIYSHKLILLYPPVILAINFRRRAENKKSGCDAQIGTFAPSHRTIGFDWCTTFWRLGWKGYPKKWWGKRWVNSKRWVEFLSPPIFCWGEIFRFPAVWVYKISSKRARVAPRSVGSLGSDWAALGSFDESFAYHI